MIKQPDFYPYKAYIANVLSYPDEVKNCQLSTNGFYKDLSGHFANSEYDNNDGASFRNKHFRVNFDENKPYSPKGARFFGRLHLDLSSIETGLPFGSKVRIELVKNNDAFVINREPNDTENYKIDITDCYLYLPIAQLSASVYNELSNVLKNKSAALHFRKTEVRVLPIPRDKIEFNSDNLYPDDIPCRIIVAFVEQKALAGDYSKNPFEFKRSWVVPKSNVQAPQLSREQALERQLRELQERFEDFQKHLEEERNAEKDTDKDKRDTEQTSFFSRFRRSFAEPPPRYQSSESELSDDPPGPTPGPQTKTIYIKKVELQLNGQPIGKTFIAKYSKLKYIS